MTGTSDADDTDWKAEADALAAQRQPRLHRRLAPWQVLGAVCDRLGVNVCDVQGNSRTSHIVEAREEYAGVSRILTVASYPEIGRALGRISHSTVACAADRWARKHAHDREAIAAEVQAIVERAQRIAA